METISREAPDHRAEALQHVAAVKAAHHALADLEAGQAPNSSAIRRANADIGVALKLADVYATLAVADRLEAALATLTPAGAEDPATSAPTGHHGVVYTTASGRCASCGTLPAPTARQVGVTL